MKKAIITLLTDFGTKDHYVASMKGTVLNINPRCILVDITHHVSPHDITEGAFILANAYSSFPKGTIHLSVVDPGVGSPRAPILLVTKKYFFVGPDNGLFTLALRKEKVRKGIVLSNPKYFLPHRSTTFHGRDLFAPVAAHLSMGVEPEAFGPILNSWVKIDFENPRIRGRALVGKILHIDAFGNLISNIEGQKLFNYVRDDSFVVRVGKRSIQGLKKAYWEGKKNDPMALIGSGGFLEVSIREGSAQKMLKVKKGDPIWISTKFQAPNSK
jgi:S-adenosylmethionine hydrolase